jgi:hypothetical protein
MAFRISTDFKNYIINKGVINSISGTTGTAGTASLSIYTGSQPANADAATSGTLLGTIGSIGWAKTTSGTAALANTAGYSGTAAATGTAGWARMQFVGVGYEGSAATFRIDGDVGTASTFTFVINSVSITSGGLITLLTTPISLS